MKTRLFTGSMLIYQRVTNNNIIYNTMFAMENDGQPLVKSKRCVLARIDDIDAWSYFPISIGYKLI